MLDAADYAAFVDPDMPGYVLATINGVSVPGLFSNVVRDALGFVSSNEPVLSAVPASVSTVPRGATVVVPAGSYTVAKIDADGIRLTKLYLEH